MKRFILYAILILGQTALAGTSYQYRFTGEDRGFNYTVDVLIDELQVGSMKTEDALPLEILVQGECKSTQLCKKKFTTKLCVHQNQLNLGPCQKGQLVPITSKVEATSGNFSIKILGNLCEVADNANDRFAIQPQMAIRLREVESVVLDRKIETKASPQKTTYSGKNYRTEIEGCENTLNIIP